MYLEKEEMKFSVVYAIKQYKAPINMDLTYRIFTWDKEIMQYFAVLYTDTNHISSIIVSCEKGMFG